MASLTLVVSRDGDDLTIGPSPVSGLWVESLTKPKYAKRRTYSSSNFHDGATLTGATKGQAERTLVMYANAGTAAELDDLCDEVTEAFEQFFFTLAVTENGVTKTWDCDMADVDWDDHDDGMADANLARATITIPCYPVPS